MNRRTLSALLFACWTGVCAVTAQTTPPAPPAPAPAVEPVGPWLRTELTLDRPQIFEHDRVRLTWTVECSETTIDSGIRIGNLPPSDQLQLSEWVELAPERKQENGRWVDRRRFETFGRVNTACVLTLAPTMDVQVITRGGGAFQTVELRRLHCDPVVLRVTPIPPPPAGLEFSGAIGRFDMDVKPGQTDIALGDLVNVTSVVRGTGWLEQITAPRMAGAPGVRLYETTLTGSNEFARFFEQTVVPTASNSVVPEVTFTYFDTGSGEYRTLRRGPFPLTFHARKSETVEVYRPAATTSGPAAATEPVRPAPLRKPADARIAPAITALVIFEIQPDADIHVLERRPDWLLVEAAGNRGWVPVDVLRDVAP